MNKMRIITVITALVVVGIYWAIVFVGNKEVDKERTIKVGFVYDGDESAPYTYNFIKAQRKIEEYDFDGRVTVTAKTNITEEKGEQAMIELINEDCDLIITTSYGYQESAKKLAKDNQCHSIGFPLISAGIFGYPLQDAWNIAVRACLDFIEHNPDYDMEIVFAVLSDSIIQEGRKQLSLDLDERIYFLKGGLNAK